MARWSRHLAALVGGLLLLGAAPLGAVAADRQLVAQIAQATPSPTPEPQPPLSEEPDLGEDEEEGAGSGSPDDGEASPRRDLPDTGAESVLIALTGLGLLALGLGLRVVAPSADGRRP